MTAVDTSVPRTTPDVAPHPGRAVTGLAVRQVRRGGIVVAVLAAGMSALVAGTYRSTVGDTLDPAALTALAQNPAVRTLFGEPVALDDPGGFTVWRTGTVVGVLLGAWALLTATRLTRGEEDAGRWNLLLAGRVPVTAVVARHLAVVGTALAVVGAAVTGALLATGTAPGGAVLHGAGMALTGVFFAAAGALAAQLFPTRGAANGAAAGLLAAGLLLRMIGEGIDALGWLRWCSPFGLVALVRPYDADRVAPLVVLALAAAALLGTAGAAAGRRDVGGGWLTPRSTRSARLRTVRSVPGFAVRRLLRPFVGWALGVSAYYLLIGLLAVSMTGFLTDNRRFADLAAQAGFGGLGTVRGYVATLFALLAVPAGVFTAVRIAALASDETDRRLTLLYAQPVTRLRLLAAETAVTAAAAAALLGVAGLATWVGTAIVGAGLTLPTALAGTVNVLPVALLCLGAAVLALGWSPRAVALVGALPAVGGFLVQVVADSIDAPRWFAGLSPFAHLAPVPDSGPDWPATAGMLLIAVLLAGAGGLGYRRRDLQG